jgi:hypothetical protein
MKTTCLPIILLVTSGVCTLAQSSTDSGQTAAIDQTGVPAPTPYQVVNCNVDHNVWQSVTYEKLTNGRIVSHKHEYTELATGLNHQQSGQWVGSKEEIQLLPQGGAAAVEGSHQAYFPGDIYDGQIELDTPDGKKLYSRPVGLSYDDGAHTVLIAALTNSIGYVINSNQVIFPDAYTGLRADLRYTYTRAGLEQDVILKQQPPGPGSLGLDPDTTRLQILTEFFDPPQPVVNTTTLATDAGYLTDDQLDFGAMQMVRGKAFLLGTNSPSVFVNKQWVQLEGRQFLVEEVPTASLADDLERLPLTARSYTTTPDRKLYVLSAKRLLPPHHGVRTSGKGLRKGGENAKGSPELVFDYQIVSSSSTNFIFQADTTYYISGSVYSYGKNIFEGGSVLKYASGATLNIVPHLGLLPSILMQASQYRPVIFTAKDDNSIGEIISGSTGSPLGYYGTMLNLSAVSPTPTLDNFRMAYANAAITCPGVSLNVNDVQFINCGYGFNTLAGSTVSLRNALFSNTATNFVFEGGCLVNAQNVTLDGSACVAQGASGNLITFTNCILSDITQITNGGTAASGAYNAFYVSQEIGSNPITNGFSPFQSVGAGNYYLATNSTCRGAGTTNINPQLLAELAKKTTYPPIVYNDGTVFTTNTTLNPQAERDNNLPPDLGYHYDPIDYVVADATVSNNVTFVLTDGTVLGWYHGNSYGPGLSLSDGSTFNTIGTATAPCWVTHALLVQEGNGNWGNATYYPGIVLHGDGLGVQPQVNSGFTRWAGMDTTANLFQDSWAYGSANFSDCEFYSGGIVSYRPSIYFTNCLFYRVATCFYDQDNAASFTFQNCGFYNGGLLATRTSGQSFSFWRVQDTTFDGTAFQWTDNYNGGTNNTYFNYNAYNTNNLGWQAYPGFSPHYGKLETVGQNDVSVTNYNWQTSWFGNYYQPTNSSLIDAGNTTANLVGLYHFTTQTNQTVEGGSIVDIGYHYVATDQYGNPLDTDGDGTPDYIEDSNGNGIFDAGDLSNWLIGPFNGLGSINGLSVFTPLK